MVKFLVTLTDEERCFLRKMVSSGKRAARKLLHGRILLQADASPEGMRYTDEAIAEALGVSLSTIHRVRQHFVEESFETALNPRRPPRRPDKVTINGEVEQQLIALACGEPPRGRGRWTVRVLAERRVARGYGARASRETVRQAFKKTLSRCGRGRRGAFRPKPMPHVCIPWRTSCGSPNGPTIDAIPSSGWTKPATNGWARATRPGRCMRVGSHARTMHMRAKGGGISVGGANRCEDGVMCGVRHTGPNGPGPQASVHG